LHNKKKVQRRLVARPDVNGGFAAHWHPLLVNQWKGGQRLVLTQSYNVLDLPIYTKKQTIRAIVGQIKD
jgi:hypothetical protein